MGLDGSLLAHCAEFARAQESGALRVVGNPHAEGLLHRLRFQGDWNNKNPFRHRPANADDDLRFIRRRVAHSSPILA
jgi:hypothetical protein